MLGYSPISAIDRIIEPCPQYDKYFDAPETGKLKVKMMHSDAGVEETVELMKDVINKNYKEVNRAKHLVKGSSTYDTARKIFDFIYKHIKYNLEPGEILHTPAAVYYHGQIMARQNPGKTSDYPIDCDDMAIMACSFLKSLGLPWALRIASYDGIKYTHVYCVVPSKSKEIIIDPVYIGFNKEKQYKMQKTFIGSTQGMEGMAGIPVYLQSVNGLSGLGGDQESIMLVSGLLSGSNFAGLGNTDEALIGYLKDTLKLAKKRPDLIAKTYPQPYIFQKMLERAISGMNTQEESQILDILAQQEKQFIAQAKSINGFGKDNDWYYASPDAPEIAGLSYTTYNGDTYFNVEGLGFFGRLGLLRKLQNKIAEKRIQKAVAKGNTAKVEKLQNKVAARTEKIVAKAEKKAEKAIAKGNTKKAEKVVNKVNRTVQMLNKANPALAPVMAKPIIKSPVKLLPTLTPPVKKAPVIAPVVKQAPVIVAPVQEQEVVPEPIIEPEQTPIEETYQETQQIEQSEPVEPITDEAEITQETDIPFESDENASDDEVMEGLTAGLHFTSLGLGDLAYPDADIIGYLKDTLKLAKKRPDLIAKTYKQPYLFQNMLERAISGLSTQEESEILDILAQQEKSNMKKPLSGLESDVFMIEGFGMVDFGGLGLFGRLGLFRKIKQKRVKKLEAKGKTAKANKLKKKIVKQDKRKAKVKKAVTNAARIFNKVNPVTVAARNGLRVLISLNFNNIAARLKDDKAAADKVRDLFSKMGGDVSKINKSIENGAKKKPLTQKTGNVQLNESVEGLGDFGAVVAMASLLSVAGKIVDKISGWIKKKADQKAAKTMLSPNKQDQESFFVSNEPVKQEKKKFFKKVVDFTKQNIKQPVQQEQTDNEQITTSPVITTESQNNVPITPKKPNYGLWAAGVVGLIATAYLARNAVSPKIDETKQNRKLSGIKLK